MFNSDKSWWLPSSPPPSSAAYLDFQSTAAHELGHFVGSGEWPADATFCNGFHADYHTMCPFSITNNISKRSLEAHDVHTFVNNY